MNFNGEMGKAKRYGVLYRVVCGVGGGGIGQSYVTHNYY